MRWVRAGVALAVVTTTFAVAEPVRAAPMNGVVFIDPVRILDVMNLAIGTTAIGVPAPPGAQQALVQLTLAPSTLGSTGVLMAHDCSVQANPATDVVLPIEDGPAAPTNDVFVPLTSGQLCLTTTAATARFVVDFKGWVTTDPGGAAYVDLPYAYVTTITGPVTSAPIDLSSFGVPSDATGVAVWLDAVGPHAGSATLHACDQPPSPRSDASWAANVPSSTLVAGTRTSAAGLCIDTFSDASIDISIDGYYRAGATPSPTSAPQVRYRQEKPPGFVGVSPTRLFDTRKLGAPILGGQVYRLDLSSFVSVDTTAVVMNVTATEPVGGGYVSVYPCDTAVPDVSSLNFGPGQTVPNLVTVDAGSTLEVCFFASATTQVLADLAGYYVLGAGDGFAPSSPVRVFDTRAATKLSAGAVFEFDFTPFVAVDASSAVFNLTATAVQGPGFVTAYPCGQPPPEASNLNISAGQTVPNLVTVSLPANKHVCFFTSSATHLLADLAGWYAPSATSGFIAITPNRWIDTRDDGSPVPAGTIAEIFFGPYFPDATAMVFNATVTQPSAAGFLTAFPCAGTPPTASNVNYVAGQTVPNMVISAVDAAGSVCLFNTASLYWIVDVGGFFTDRPLFVWFYPVGTDIT